LVGEVHVLVDVPFWDQDATERLVQVIDLLAPDPEVAAALAQRFPLYWSMSVMGGEAFEVRPLLNGVVLVRNMHRVLGPALWEGGTLEMDPLLNETLTADLGTLRARNAEGEPACFVLTHDAQGARLLGSEDPVDLGAPGWGQLIAICALQPEDLEDGSGLRTDLLRELGASARSGVVFLRFFGDRVDLIPAARFDDDLDIFLEELSFSGLSDSVLGGTELPAPVYGEALINAIIERTENETGHLPDEGLGVTWFRAVAVRALAERLASTMSWGTVNFGLGPDPDGPRRAVPLPAGIGEALAADPELRRRSVTLQIMANRAGNRELIRDDGLDTLIAYTLERVTGGWVETTVSGRVDLDQGADAPVPALEEIQTLPDTFARAVTEITDRAEAAGECPDEAIEEAGLGIVLLIDFPEERPADRMIAATACALSQELGETVRLFMNGRGEYFAYAEGEVDSGDHELIRPDGDDEDRDEGDDHEEEQDD
jgi:hypothetical protein